MLRILFLLTISLCSQVLNAAVYRSVDEQGNVIYTDKPLAESEKVQIQPPPTVVMPKPTPATKSAPATTQSPSKPVEKKFTGYQRLSIIAPSNDEVIRENSGRVSVSVNLAPILQIQEGHQLAVRLDGQLLDQRWSNTHFNLDNISRGTHSLQVIVTSSKQSSTAMIKSDSISFHMKRFSSRF